MSPDVDRPVGEKRTVHACYPGMEIVHYANAGEWYLEPTDLTLKRQQVVVDDAARQAIWGLAKGGEVFLNQPGGQVFDHELRGAGYRA